MGEPVIKERRGLRRRKLTGLLPGRLTSAEDDRNISSRPLNVSKNGLGLLISEQFNPGTRLILSLSDQEIELEVIWGQPDFGKRDLYRYGLMSLNPEVDLEEIFIQSGCLK